MRPPLSPSPASRSRSLARPLVHRSQFVGLDTLSHIASGWRAERVSTGEIDAKQVEEVGLLEKLVGEGKKGRKSGQGLFDCASTWSSSLRAGPAVLRGRRRWLLVLGLLLTLAPSLASQTRTSRVAVRLSVLLISVQPVSRRTRPGTLQCSRRFAFSCARRPPARFARRHVFRPLARLHCECIREL